MEEPLGVHQRAKRNHCFPSRKWTKELDHRLIKDSGRRPRCIVRPKLNAKRHWHLGTTCVLRSARHGSQHLAVRPLRVKISPRCFDGSFKILKDRLHPNAEIILADQISGCFSELSRCRDLDRKRSPFPNSVKLELAEPLKCGDEERLVPLARTGRTA